MSLRSKKVSAFSVFRGRKANSMSNVDEVGITSPTFKLQDNKTKKSKKKSKSTSNTPTSSRDSSISSLADKLSNSEKKKQKSDVKKLKKFLKGTNKQRPSFLPDSAIQSPLSDLNGGNVQLKALRPKGSMINMNYSLPLKANFVPKETSPNKFAGQQSQHVDGVSVEQVINGGPGRIPSLPPRHSVIRSSKTSIKSGSVPPLPPRQSNKRSSMRNTDSTDNGIPSVPPRRHLQGSQNQTVNDPFSAPLQPCKRRKISQGSPGQKSPINHSFPKKPSVGSIHGPERTEPMPTHPADSQIDLPYMYHSVEEATKVFECLIHPVKPQKFFSELWERKPLLVKRHMPTYNDGWFSTQELDRILREHRIMFTSNIDVTSYENGKRETHNPIGRAFAPIVWDYYQNGCSVRMLNPQTYSRNVWKLLSILQEFFGSCVGANTYLTPPGTQGFSPHYDDIEAFILQLEGKKHWRLYNPRSEAETLPRFSSGNFQPDDIGEPILDVILEAGDLLYFPRGIIHQGRTLEDAHSLHITVSCCQKNTWADFFEKLVPRALEIASSEDLEFRKALPKDYLNYMGIAFADSYSNERKSFLRTVEQLMMKLLSHAPVDGAVDQMGKRFLHDTLPPVFTETEKQKSIHGCGEHWSAKDKRVRGAIELEPDTKIKLIRKGVIRLVTEDEKICVYYNLENTRIFHDVDEQFIEISTEMAPAVEHLLHSYPEYVTVDSFPMDNVEDKVGLAVAMYEKGMLMTEEALEPVSDGSSEDDND